MSNYSAVIMAGGGGTRLWPLSRQATPKQSIQLLGSGSAARTLYQIAVDRLSPLFPAEQILVVTNSQYAPSLQEQQPAIPHGNFIIEPQQRGTAPALGLAALAVRQRDPHGLMACLTADHFMQNEPLFRQLLMAAAEVAKEDHLVTLGVTPTFPSTGMGYIQRGEALGQFGEFAVYRVARFKEKPQLEAAQAMLADGLHSWNSGMFIWKGERLMAEFARQMPDFHTQLLRIEGDPAALNTVWASVPNVTIDYGIMEHAQEVAVIPAGALGWDDVGSWEAVFEVLPHDKAGNAVVGTELLGLDTHDTLIHSSNGRRKLVATIGVKDLIVVDTGDVLLICPREKAQDVRALVAARTPRADGIGYL
ncbi:MAG: mannose-1-phosphate guanylyltransferase [Anaerolineales bacterium]